MRNEPQSGHSIVARIAIVGVFLFASNLWAQVNTSSIRGTVRDAAGGAVADAEVTLIHEPSQNQKSTRTNASGAFAFNGLRVGGPYRLIVFSEGYEATEKDSIQLNAGKREYIAMTLHAAEVIELIGTAPTPRTTSTSSQYDSAEIFAAPAVDNDLKSVIRMDPNVVIDGTENEMSIGGVNSRFNSITIDGIRENDDFGLNNNGYPTQRSPISLFAIEQISVETSPFDVRYGQFLGGNVNIVTKSGTNEFRGALLQSFANDALSGKKSGDDTLDIDFSEVRYNAVLGGPIIKDKLHFFISAEGLSASTPISVGPAGSGAANEVGVVSQADVARVQDIARTVYDFDAGVPSQAIDESDFKLLAKVDWAISERHRLTTKYQRTRGNVVNSFFGDEETLAMTSTWFNRDDRLHSYAVRLFSDWSNKLSTQFEVSGKIVDNRQEPLSGNEFMSAQIRTADGGTVNIGADVFRHANKLDTNQIHAKAEVSYLLGQHVIVGGLEYDRVGVKNLFVPFSDGQVTFDSIDAFENQTPSSIFYLNAITNDHNDGEVEWSYGVATLFLQDQFAITDKLTAQGGARVELYQSGDPVKVNENFADRYSFDNSSTVDGNVLVLPRLGVTFRPIDRLNLRGGVGIYSGGTPNVWLSNNYSNDGVTFDTAFSADPAVVDGFNGRDIPQAMQDELAAGDGNVNALDPDFKVPSSWKVSAGVDYAFDIPALGRQGKDFKVKLDYNYSKVRHALLWNDLRRNNPAFGDANVAIGELPDGRPYFDNDDTDGSAYNPRRGHDLLLTNTDKGHGHTFSISLEKKFPLGLRFEAAYAYQNVKEVSPAAGAVAFLAYGQAAVVDPNDPDLATSNYERRHRVVGSLSLNRPLIRDLTGTKSTALKNLHTTISLLWETRSGQPFSYTFGGFDNAQASLFGEEVDFTFNNRNLFYVPTQGDPNVILDGIDEAEFNRFLADTGLDEYRGQIAARNAFRGPWYNRLDLRLVQELVENSGAKLIIDIRNLGNMLNTSWGRYEQPGFPFTAPVVDVDVDPATGNYIYSNLRTDDPARVDVLQSVWRMQASLMFEF